MSAFPSVIDRGNARREEPGLVDALRADAATQVLAIHRGTARVAGDRLVVDRAEQWADAEWALLGWRESGEAVLLASLREEPVATETDTAWRGMREVAATLPADDAELLIMGAALDGWLRDAAFCPRCGAHTELASAGWSRHCPQCQAQHFPRTDPAVIVAIESADGERLLLGANVLWKGTMFSCFAGFVEAGESLEAAVHREIEEEAGVVLDAVSFFGSQPWPYPRSLMVGFHAVARDEQAARPDGEEITQVRWFTRAEIRSALTGEGPVGLPGPASIARRLIEAWVARA